MKKLLAAVIASSVALSGISFAADTAKREDLTQSQRAEMRNRADQLTSARANGNEQKTAQTDSAPAPKKHSTKTHKSTKHTTKKVEPKS